MHVMRCGRVALPRRKWRGTHMKRYVALLQYETRVAVIMRMLIKMACEAGSREQRLRRGYVRAFVVRQRIRDGERVVPHYMRDATGGENA